MALNLTYPTSVHVGFIIEVGWSNTYGDSFFTVSRQTNNNTTWLGVPYSPDSSSTRYLEEVEATWERVRYRVSGLPSGTISTTGWITVVGGSDPGGGGGTDPGGGGGTDPDPDPTLPPLAPTVLTPLAPTVLTPHSVTPNISFSINWTDTNGTTVEYDIEESVNGGTYQRIASSWLSKSYSRTPSSEWNTVKYRVRAIGGVLTSAWSYSLMIEVTAPVQPPTVPTISVTPTTVAGSGSVTISWSSTSGGTYDLQRSTNDGSTWTTVLTKISSTSRTESVSQTTSYRARAYKNDLYSAYSSSATVTVTAAPPTAPTVSSPTSVIATRTLSFSWTDSNSGATYEVARSVDDGAYTVLVSSQTSKSYSEFANPAWTKIRYRIIVSKDGLSAPEVYTSFIQVIPIPSIPSLSYPSDVAVGESISLSWTDSNSGAFYTIKRSINGGSYTTLTTTSSKYYTETAQNSWSSVKYAVFASKGGASSVEAVTETITIYGALTTPTVHSVLTVEGGKAVTLTWTDSNSGATYEVERNVDGGAYSTLTSDHVSKSYTTYTTDGWTTVRYRVRAKKDDITTDWGYSPIITIEKLISSKMSVKVGSEVRNAVDGWVMVNGTLRKITDIWVMVNGTLKKS